MARVNVEQKALTDTRFKILGLELGAPPELAHAAGIGAMVYLWNECQERETETLREIDLRAIFGLENMFSALLKAELGTKVKGGRIRIKGTKGRIEWLAKRRKEGRLGGKKGGRPPSTPTPSNPSTPRGLPQETPPAPALKAGDESSETASIIALWNHFNPEMKLNFGNIRKWVRKFGAKTIYSVVERLGMTGKLAEVGEGYVYKVIENQHQETLEPVREMSPEMRMILEHHQQEPS